MSSLFMGSCRFSSMLRLGAFSCPTAVSAISLTICFTAGKSHGPILIIKKAPAVSLPQGVWLHCLFYYVFYIYISFKYYLCRSGKVNAVFFYVDCQSPSRYLDRNIFSVCTASLLRATTTEAVPVPQARVKFSTPPFICHGDK